MEEHFGNRSGHRWFLQTAVFVTRRRGDGSRRSVLVRSFRVTYDFFSLSMRSNLSWSFTFFLTAWCVYPSYKCIPNSMILYIGSQHNFPTHSNTILTTPVLLSLTPRWRHQAPVTHEVTTGENNVPERRDVEGGHGGDGSGPRSSNKAQLRRGSGRYGTQEHDHLPREVDTCIPPRVFFC